MHTVIPHAAPSGDQCRAALPQLQLPNLAALLELLTPTPPLIGTADSLSPLHERVHAKAVGLQGADGLIPWAALDAHHLGLTKSHGTTGWAWVTPCHWDVQADHVSMEDPHHLNLDAHESEALRAAMQQYFAEDGITLHTLSNSTWLAHGEVFAELPTASVARACGNQVDSWIPRLPQAQKLRRLQNEMQMLLYTHPVNDARGARGATTVNSFWVSGTGRLDVAPPPVEKVEVLHALDDAARRDDAHAWLEAWHTLDRTVIATLLNRAKANQAMELTLCGERMAPTFILQSSPWWNRLQRKFTAPPPPELLATL